MDDRLHLAATLEREADQDFRAATWFMDLATERCAAKRDQARRLREHVAQELEIQEIVRQEDAELARKGRAKPRWRKARAA